MYKFLLLLFGFVVSSAPPEVHARDYCCRKGVAFVDAATKSLDELLFSVGKIIEMQGIAIQHFAFLVFSFTGFSAPNVSEIFGDKILEILSVQVDVDSLICDCKKSESKPDEALFLRYKEALGLLNYKIYLTNKFIEFLQEEIQKECEITCFFHKSELTHEEKDQTATGTLVNDFCENLLGFLLNKTRHYQAQLEMLTTYDIVTFVINCELKFPTKTESVKRTISDDSDDFSNVDRLPEIRSAEDLKNAIIQNWQEIGYFTSKEHARLALSVDSNCTRVSYLVQLYIYGVLKIQTQPEFMQRYREIIKNIGIDSFQISSQVVDSFFINLKKNYNYALFLGLKNYFVACQNDMSPELYSILTERLTTLLNRGKIAHNKNLETVSNPRARDGVSSPISSPRNVGSPRAQVREVKKIN